MVLRRMNATRDELSQLVAGRLDDADAGVVEATVVGAVLGALADLGVPVDALVKIEVDEEV